MVLKAARLNLKTAEVPVRFYKDRDGRLSHHKRAGWLSPWNAGWINLKVMFLYAPDFFVMKPGWLMLVSGLLLSFALCRGPVFLSPSLGLDLHSMLLGMTMATLGYSAIQLGTLARVFYNFNPPRRRRLAERFTYNRGMISAVGLTGVGLMIDGLLAYRWVRGGLRLQEISYPALLGLLLIILGFQTFIFTLLFQMINLRHERAQE
jgi:hypothetical protein